LLFFHDITRGQKSCFCPLELPAAIRVFFSGRERQNTLVMMRNDEASKGKSTFIHQLDENPKASPDLKLSVSQ
jgi:hypothetical protein